jgi:hypothetical protein
LVVGPAQVPATPEDRAAAIALLVRAAQKNNLHTNGWTPPHRLDVSFTAIGNLPYTGPGTFTELWLSGQNWRWNTTFGPFSQTRIGFHRQPFDDRPVAETPMRLHMLRNAIFWFAGVQPSPNALIRVAPVTWNGRPVTCLLLSKTVAAATQSRQWEEEEYCVDDASGLLQIHSIAPGTYAVYSYGANLFHDLQLPERITVYVAGVTAIDAQIQINDVSGVDPSQFTPTPDMTANGIALRESGLERISMDVPNPTVRTIQPAIVIAEMDGQGNVVEEELSAAADPALAHTALDLVMNTNLG